MFNFLLAQNGDLDAAAGAAAGAALVILVVYLAVIILCIAGMWKAFAKAGKPGWAAIVPIYNYIVMLEIAGKPVWWIILMLIPIVNIVVILIMLHAFAAAYGKGVGFLLGMIFLPFIFWPMLGFGSAQYQGNAQAA